MDAAKTRKSGRNVHVQFRTAPRKPKSGLSGPPVRPRQVEVSSGSKQFWKLVANPSDREVATCIRSRFEYNPSAI